MNETIKFSNEMNDWDIEEIYDILDRNIEKWSENPKNRDFFTDMVQFFPDMPIILLAGIYAKMYRFELIVNKEGRFIRVYDENQGS